MCFYITLVDILLNLSVRPSQYAISVHNICYVVYKYLLYVVQIFFI